MQARYGDRPDGANLTVSFRARNATCGAVVATAEVITLVWRLAMCRVHGEVSLLRIPRQVYCTRHSA